MKIINLLFLIIFLFQSTPILGMDEDEGLDGLDEFTLILLGKAKVPSKVSTPLATEDKKNESTRLKKSEDQNDTGRSDDDCCTHWGLKHWFYGIKEYVIDRCLCCGECGFDPIDGDRAYIQETYHIITSDCWCVAYVTKPDGADNCLTSTVCCPCSTLTHLICLPVACCYPTKKDWWGTESGDNPTITKLRKKQKKEEERERERERNREDDDRPSLVPYYGGNSGDGMSCPYYQTNYLQGGMGGVVFIKSCTSQLCSNCGKVHQLKVGY